MSARVFRCFGWLLIFSFIPLARSADVDAAKKSFLNGQYESVAETAEKAMARDRDEEWRLLLIRSQMAVGKYRDALSTVTNNLRRFPTSLKFRLLAHEVFLANGQNAAAAEMVDEMN